jgi:hypothetical protein
VLQLPGRDKARYWERRERPWSPSNAEKVECIVEEAATLKVPHQALTLPLHLQRVVLMRYTGLVT